MVRSWCEPIPAPAPSHGELVDATEGVSIVLRQDWAWQFNWPSEDAMAEELERWYAGAAERLAHEVTAKPGTRDW